MPPDSKTTEKLVPQALALRNCREPTVLNFFGVQFEGVFGELEAFLHERGQLTNPASLLAENFLGMSSTDDDLTRIYGTCKDDVRDTKYLGACGGDADITARVTFLGEFTGKELIEFSAEDTIRDKLALFTDLTGHFEE